MNIDVLSFLLGAAVAFVSDLVASLFVRYIKRKQLQKRLDQLGGNVQLGNDVLSYLKGVENNDSND